MTMLDVLKPRHRHSDPAVRREAVRSLADETVCADLASTDPDTEVRRLALAHVRTVELLRRIAVRGEHLDTRLQAVARITDPWVLAGILEERKNPDLMVACFEGIRDQEVLAHIARSPSYNVTARKIAIDMFADEGLLREVLASLRAPALKQAVVARLEGDDAAEAVHSQRAGERSDPDGRMARILETFDPETVAEVLGTFRDSVAAARGLGAVMRCEGPAAGRAQQLALKLLRHQRAEIRAAAVSALAARSAESEVRNALQTAARADDSAEVRAAAAAALGAGPV